ncbi:erythrocyte membrane-associated antigen [Cryptosporidium sp. chipmunk genotype I]|uniref:erythrocyte membrane-associated antigen n=1 Tax=Cryptosporidium sp. chipmunk genotype I TaxID=1280935 RepID=UPI00351A5152|nr:erythrocyte membrane-associated antigen [Cryptosporidium sp. chipmunk genotype I]
MGINELLPFLIILLLCTGGVYSEENGENIAESQINEDNLIGDFDIEDEDSRSLMSLSNIQNDIWSDRFANGFSSIELENNSSGIIHLLNNNSHIQLGSDEYIVTSSNMPNYDSLIVFVEDITYSSNSNAENKEIKNQNLLIITNETENEILIKSNRLSNGFVCMGILNGTEIWSREFCEIVQGLKIDEITCSCKGSFIYSLVESRDQNRALQMQYNKFNFPDFGNSGTTQVHHVNDAYLSRVSRNDDPNSNHGDKVPFPPLHGSIGGRSSNANTQNKETPKSNTINGINFEQNELMQYYHSGSTNKYVISNQDSSHTYDNSRLNELNHKNLVNKETNQVNSNLIESNNIRKNPWNINNYNDLIKKSHSIINKNIHTDFSEPKVDSITINMKLKKINFESFNNTLYKQSFVGKFVNSLSKALNLLPSKLRIINIWNEENSSLRGNSGSIGATVNIITSLPDEIIAKVKNLKTQICEFSKIYEFYLISISKNIGSKSISNEIITDKPEEKEREFTYDRESLRALPIIFTMDLRTRKPYINQKEAFALLEDELSKSMKIPKSSIDIPEFTYKQLNDPFTNEVYLMIHTEIWVHPEKQIREEYSSLLTNIYSNIIHNKRSSFSSIFLCNKHEIKEIPHIRTHSIEDMQKSNLDKNAQEFPGTKIGLNKETEPTDEGRISKIGRFYQINQNIQSNHSNSQSKKGESVESIHQNLYSQNTNENTQINPVIYLFKE